MGPVQSLLQPCQISVFPLSSQISSPSRIPLPQICEGGRASIGASGAPSNPESSPKPPAPPAASRRRPVEPSTMGLPTGLQAPQQTDVTSVTTENFDVISVPRP